MFCANFAFPAKLVRGGKLKSPARLVELKRFTTYPWLPRLCQLDIRNTNVTNEGLIHLKHLTQLAGLVLMDNQVTDDGLFHLTGLAQIGYLDFRDTQVSNAELAQLTGLTKLRELKLGNTRVTDAGVVELQKALPKCKISP